MNKSILLILLLALTGTMNEAFSQATLWMGYRNTNNTLTGYDTSTWSVSTSLSLTTDFSGTVTGCYGLSLNPNSNEMFIAYRTSPGGTTAHRLGTVDLTSGAITDIGDVGNVQDLAFVGGTLYGLVGSNGGKAIVEVDITDASTSAPLITFSTSSSHGICWDYYNDRILRTAQGGGNFSEIDLSTWTESIFAGSTHPGWTNTMTMLDSTTALVAGSCTLWEWDMTTLTHTTVTSAGCYPHSIAFDQYPLYIIADGPTTYCSNEPTQLGVSESGTAYQWMLDGAPVAGATDSAYVPVASGTYTCDVDGSISIATVITILTAPEASFTAVPNPVDLGVDGTGTITFTNTSTGGDDYHWDFDNGFTSSSENTAFPFTSVGMYDVEYIVYDLTNGCSDTAWVTVEVINSTGIGELNADFSVYPIPAEDIVTISAKEGHDAYTIDLISMSGQLISRNTMAANANNTQFDVSDIEAGVYLVKIYNDIEEGYVRVVKK